jgi:hypothetical protein
MTDKDPPTWRQMAPFPDYSLHEPSILELEDTVQLCSDCGDVIPSGNESCRCANCREDYELEKAQAIALRVQNKDTDQ